MKDPCLFAYMKPTGMNTSMWQEEQEFKEDNKPECGRKLGHLVRMISLCLKHTERNNTWLKIEVNNALFIPCCKHQLTLKVTTMRIIV